MRWHSGARYRTFASAAGDEAALEIGEGVPEYTGVKLALTTNSDRIAFAIHDLSAFVAAPTFVRSFAYATGPAYGLFLDRADPAWRTKLGTGKRLDELLATALAIQIPAKDSVEHRAAAYDGAALRTSEVERDREKRAQLADYKARLVDGPVLVLPVINGNYQFNPQTLVPLEGYGTIYPTMRLTDDWGALEVERGGALVQGAAKKATVTAVGADIAGLSGDGWRLMLKPGWHLAKGKRAGDLAVVRAPLETP